MSSDPTFSPTPGSRISLHEFRTDNTGKYKSKKEAKKKLKKDIERLKHLQDKFYAYDRFSLLIIFQAMDAAGKDGTIKHVMSGVNPQGCQVYNFKKPSAEELDHDYLWRIYKCLPERGRIGIFNRSYYEEVLIVRVHPDLVLRQRLPAIHSLQDINDEFWKKRYQQINRMEEHLVDNGTIILKFFLNVSKNEQKARFLDRINDPDKNWKFTMDDVQERKYWEDYQHAFEEAISATNTVAAPWYIIPADHKWYMRTIVGDVIVKKLNSLPLKYPEVTQEKKDEIRNAKKLLESEN